MFLRISQYSQENIYFRVSFNKVAGLQACLGKVIYITSQCTQ